MKRTPAPIMTPENPSEVSEFYLACRNGDIKFVKDYLMKLSDARLNVNNFEPNVKSTPLHAASYYGRKEIVRLLLEHECDRSQINGYGLTAYEEAANDEIRQLFKRPTDGSGIHRFYDETTDGCFYFVKRPKEIAEEEINSVPELPSETKKIPSVYGYRTEAEKQLEVGYSTTSIAMCQSRIGRFIADRFQHDAPMSLKSMADRLQEIIDKEIISNKNLQSEKANELLNKFVNDSDDKSIEHLIRLYTLEPKFYSSLRQNPMALALPLYMSSETLKNRHFQGQSFRGAKMDYNDIAIYQWAVNNPGSLLQTRHFVSTSLKRSIAEEFANGVHAKGHNMGPNSVLFMLNFMTKCEQAVNLCRISDEEPCLSEFEDEAEVLILPWTLFRVDSVKKQSESSYTIRLTNVVLPHKNMLSSLKWILKHPKGSLDRFHEFFPERQPEMVVKELMKSFTITDENILKRKD